MDLVCIYYNITVRGLPENFLQFYYWKNTAVNNIPQHISRTYTWQLVSLDNKSRDFFFLKRYDADIIIRVVIALIQEKLPKYVDARPFEIQVLTPMRKGLLGVERMNQILQRYLNPPEPGKKEKEIAAFVIK